ncbi:hypothetical protein HJC23_009079 [Cyclotella cryptica]|uniref:Uncharacterized protein n=1 Tax=Cyclotella cryptica TaxID=29204 RepID=A0ABD3QZD0_9STRA
MDGQLKSKYRFAVRMVEDGTLEPFEDVKLSDDAYDMRRVIRMITGKDIIGVKGMFHSSTFDDDTSKTVDSRKTDFGHFEDDSYLVRAPGRSATNHTTTPLENKLTHRKIRLAAFTHAKGLRHINNSATPLWSNSTIGGGFTKEGLRQWAVLTDFGILTDMSGQEMRRRKRLLNDDSKTLPYVDLLSRRISKQCSDYLVLQPSPSSMLGRAFFGSNRFLIEKIFLMAMNSAFSLYPRTGSKLPTFELNDRYLHWTVTMSSPLELICSWELKRYGVKGCTMMAFDPSLKNVYHGNCMNVPMERLGGFFFRNCIKLHVMYANFLLGGMVNELESISMT